MERQSSIEFEIEDYLQSKNLFINGISGKPCHSDSYMTLVEYKVLDEIIKDNPYTKENWIQAVTYWLTNENMQPPLKLVGLTLNRVMQLNVTKTN